MRLGLIQLLVEGGEPERNLQRAEKLITQAAELGADIVLLPETTDFAWTHPSALEEAEPIPGKYSNFFSKLAAKYQVYILVGLTEKTSVGNYNAAVFLNPQGAILHKYRKINLLEVEHPYYQIGRSLSVIETPWGMLGINICADNYIDSLHIGHALARMGADFILSPSSWTVNHDVIETIEPYEDKWLKPFQILASYHNLIVASTTSVGYIVGGPYEGKKMMGGSLVVGKSGIIKSCKLNEFASVVEVLNIEIPTRTLKGTQIGQNLLSRGWKTDNLLDL
jgi:predicted amidohydrolase